MNLCGEWKLYYSSDALLQTGEPEKYGLVPLPGRVPSNVEIDLAEAGLLPKDIAHKDGLKQAEKYEKYQWWYEREFSPEPPKNGEKVILRFEAVDCIADYYLNGKAVSHSENALIPHEIDVTGRLLYGQKNRICVNIRSALLWAAQKTPDPFALLTGWLSNPVSTFLRKPPHCFGWDIMPRALSAGIWREVHLEYRLACRFRDLLFYFRSLGKTSSQIGLAYSAEIPGELAMAANRLEIAGCCNGHKLSFSQTVYGNAGKVVFEIDNETLWWPRHYGNPNLYDLTLRFFDPSGKELICQTLRQGFRKAELVRTDTVCENGKFEFHINGEKVMAIGSNWVPLDFYHSRDAKRLDRVLALAEEAGCNILRCWGGNVYEDREFFQFCDERGIMVWQDFAMACYYYPQTGEFARQLTDEVTAVVRKLRNYACLVLWCGDNEIDSMVSGVAGVDPSVNRLTREVIPSVLCRLDPQRPYIPSSPYISTKAMQGGPQCHPEDHLWGPRDYYKSEYYRSSKAYFVSETGYHGCPDAKTVVACVGEKEAWPYRSNPLWNFHSTDQHNNDARVMLMHNQVQKLFGRVPDNLEEFVFASQASQAEAKKYFIERVRAQSERMGGVIWWNLMDGWPQMSDAVVDYYFRKKAAFSVIRRCQGATLAFIGEWEEGGYPLLLSRNGRTEAVVAVTVEDLTDTKVLLTAEGVALPGKTVRIGRIIKEPSQQGMLLIRYREQGQKEKINHYLFGNPPFSLKDYRRWSRQVENAES